MKEPSAVSGPFNQTSTRDKKATEYFQSGPFLAACRTCIEGAVVVNGSSYAEMGSYISPRTQDMPYIRAAFATLKKEYPELNHVRINLNNYLVFDTKPNTFLRRALQLIP